MVRSLPSLNSLRAFEAAARHLSFTKGAEELNVTQGAVSHQVKGLEDYLGLKLFLRRHQGLVLTEAGQNCQMFVRDAFDRLTAGFDGLLAKDNAGILTVSVSPNFATKWLVPRVSRFSDCHPDIDLRISATANHIDFAREDVDVAVRHGEGDWPDLKAICLMTERLLPVCSPRLLTGPHALKKPEDLIHHPLIHTDSRLDWSGWLENAGVRGIDVSKGTIFNLRTLALDAAVDGHGVALGRSALAAMDILSGRLVRPFGPSLPVRYAYYLVCPKATADRPKIKAFREWMIEEATADEERMSELGVFDDP